MVPVISQIRKGVARWSPVLLVSKPLKEVRSRIIERVKLEKMKKENIKNDGFYQPQPEEGYLVTQFG
ncbi:hypothetical protein C5167_020272 [Papaver somniferum]|uniref:Uncharacterized protein n=1 Tax=Papaver somniferum TaxID=3469 RepID=A0A4Y7IWR7_PAPSO|nr:hypothetical protein C5167_020272 [Papaver somniferum]